MSAIIEQLVIALNNYGPVLTMVAVLLVLNSIFIYRDWRREDSQRKQIAILHKTHNEIVIPLLTECKEAIAGCREVIGQNSVIITGWLQHGGR